jgi:L-aspartate oxidase
MDPDALDLLVIGSGIAGLTAALIAAPRARVAVVTKAALEEGCSRYAQGGIAAAVAADDSPQLHYADTIAAGRGLCDPRAVRVLVEEGPRRVRQLVEWGVRFDTQDGDLLVGREAAHSRSRILHARGDATGLEIETALVARLRASGARILERHEVVQLLGNDAGTCIGVEVRDTDTGALRRLTATSTVLASGGAGRLWRHTTNPEPATGDGIALAWELGAQVASMEFVQFHPTALALPGAPRFLISEAVRGEGAQVIDSSGRRFLFDADPRGELAPRDVVAQEIWRELRRSGEGSVFLDCSGLADRAAVRFPTISETCRSFGIDIRTDPIPIAPAAHYLIGGVRTDLRGASSVPGLFACGEVASSGIHGANRLASNSLLESVVFAHRAAAAALERAAEAPPPSLQDAVQPPSAGRSGDDAAAMARLSDAMWDGAGVVRDAAGLRRAGEVVEGLGETSRRVAAAATTASLVCAAALSREESRGCHVRADFPESDAGWRGLWIMDREKGGDLDRDTGSDD